MIKSWLTIVFLPPSTERCIFPPYFAKKSTTLPTTKLHTISVFLCQSPSIFFIDTSSQKNKHRISDSYRGIPPFKIFDILKIFKLVVIAHFTTAQKHCIFNVFNLYYISIVSISPISIHPVRGGIFTYFT